MATNGRRMAARWICLSCLALPAAGCDQAGSAGSARTAAKGSTSSGMQPIRDLHRGKPISDEEAREWGEALIAELQAGQDSTLSKLIDWWALADRATSGIDAPEKFRAGFSQGASNSAGAGFAGQLRKEIKQGASLHLLRIREIEEQPRVLLRLISPGSGVSYQDHALARHADGHVRSVDLFIYVTGETMSEALRRGYFQVALAQKKDLLSRITGKENLLVKHLNEFQQIAEHIQAERYAEALQVYAGLPAELQKDKFIQVLRLRAAQGAGDVEYRAALEDLEKLAPTDGSLDLLMLDGYFLKQEYRKAMRCVNRLDKALGGDPYLNVIRANLYEAEGKPEKALSAIQAAIEGEPDLIDPYWTLVTLQLHAHDFDAVVETLNQVSRQFSIQFQDLTQIPEYSEFVMSPQYQEWVKLK